MTLHKIITLAISMLCLLQATQTCASERQPQDIQQLKKEATQLKHDAHQTDIFARTREVIDLISEADIDPQQKSELIFAAASLSCALTMANGRMLHRERGY